MDIFSSFFFLKEEGVGMGGGGRQHMPTGPQLQGKTF